MDNTKQIGPTISSIFIMKPTKKIFQNPCEKCLIRACCSVLCQDRIEYFKSMTWKDFEDNYGK